ncbi:uncharacterized protein BO66DRAFT_455486 [Aspergillus aculeatinus CBS 121060]|uniref:Uncharacterized protein n=1 Tax=Aspergillus aculeatinus CBS 121060 TaxID=1448322 RepID=A0ACD1H4M3_9EURO|nr:hypothetical protein BO66DRAFT_455486 [Aspergillus aculeatinus CBS 121060]RAH68360.1 hypothetical protein BO66DRAFT_455486 [Aspergillus aculeatinus CBS 121060]
MHLLLATGALILQTALGLAPQANANGGLNVFEIKPNANITGHSITFEEADCPPSLSCRTTQTCKDSNAVPSILDLPPKKYFACCTYGTHLLGSPQTAWDCCADGHELAGPSGQGDYRCCPTGNIYTAGKCAECTGGKTRVDNKCVCPEGMIEGPKGDCQPPQTCPQGKRLVAGKCKCYLISRRNGQYLSLGEKGEYSFALPDGHRLMGRFQVCTEQSCSSSHKSVNPSDAFYLRDTFNGGVWVDGSSNGRHISQTTDFESAGKFSLTKWGLGSYCLGGSGGGVGAACSSDTPGITFLPGSPQTCFPVILTEVPCDTKSHYNSCGWGVRPPGNGKVAADEL